MFKPAGGKPSQRFAVFVVMFRLLFFLGGGGFLAGWGGSRVRGDGGRNNVLSTIRSKLIMFVSTRSSWYDLNFHLACSTTS